MNKKMVGITLFLVIISFGVFGQTSQQATRLVQQFKSMASDAEKIAKDIVYADERTLDMANSFANKYPSLVSEYQSFTSRGGTFTSVQENEIQAAMRRIENAMRVMAANAQKTPQERPRQWSMVVEYKLNQYDTKSSHEFVNVSATSLEEAKEKAKRSVKMQYSWAYIVDAKESR